MRTRRHDQEPPQDDLEVAVLPGAVLCRGERPLQLPTFGSTGQEPQPVRKRGLLKCATSLKLGRNVACPNGADPMDLPKKSMIRLVNFAVRANDGKLGKPSTGLGAVTPETLKSKLKPGAQHSQVTDLLPVIQEPLLNSSRATQRLELYVGFGRRPGTWFKDGKGC